MRLCVEQDGRSFLVACPDLSRCGDVGALTKVDRTLADRRAHNLCRETRCWK